MFLIVTIESKSMSDASGSREDIRPAINVGVSVFLFFFSSFNCLNRLSFCIICQENFLKLLSEMFINHINYWAELDLNQRKLC